MADQITKIKEIATALGISPQATRKRAENEEWPTSAVKTRGGGATYEISALPQYVQEALLDHAITTLPQTDNNLPAPAQHLPAEVEETPPPAQLPKWQRDAMDARFVILAYLDELAEQSSLSQAITRLVARSKAGVLPDHIQSIIQTANVRTGTSGRTLTRRTLFRWRNLRDQARTYGNSSILAPRAAHKKSIPAWADYFLKCYRKPQKPSVPDALEELRTILPEGIQAPSRHQAYRFLKTLSTVEREKGRRTGSELKAVKAFRRRGTEDLLPLDVVQCDGHSFKAHVAHPVHGRPFKPEVCACIDARTRVVIGWSAGLAESADTVADALRHACTIGENKPYGGIPAIFYTDPGSGNKANVNAHPAYGRYARLGIDFKTGIPGNSQARGMVERMQQSLWIRAAKQLDTYTGTGMDSRIANRTGRLLDKDIRTNGSSKRLISWPQFLDLCEQAVERYNHTPHSSLPKITDSEDKRRHMTPAEMWETHLHQGWTPDTCSAQELTDLFRPRVQKATRRGEVRLFGNTYFHQDLQHHHGEQVFVEYEPQDGEYVYVRDMEERLICKAGFEANKSSIQPVSAIEDARDKRATGRLKRLEVQQHEVEAERRGVIETETRPVDFAAIEAEAKQFEADLNEQPQQQTASIGMDRDRADYIRWKKLDELRTQGIMLDEEEERFLEGFAGTAAWQTQKDLEEDFPELYSQAQ